MKQQIDKDNFKISYHKSVKDLNYYIGRQSICTIIITDIKGEQYESEMHLKTGWEKDKYQQAIVQSFLLCDDTPASVYIEKFELTN